MRCITLIVVFCFFCRCSGDDLYRSTIRSADSLSGALNTAVRELSQPDSATLAGYIRRYSYYEEFIARNVNDTITRQQADGLQLFVSAGGNIQNFTANRKTLLERAALVQSQLQSLTADLEHRRIPAAEGVVALANEKKEVTQLIPKMMEQKTLIHLSVQNLRANVNIAEQVIRSRNKGDLPRIIQDTIPF